MKFLPILLFFIFSSASLVAQEANKVPAPENIQPGPWGKRVQPAKFTPNKKSNAPNPQRTDAKRTTDMEAVEAQQAAEKKEEQAKQQKGKGQ